MLTMPTREESVLRYMLEKGGGDELGEGFAASTSFAAFADLVIMVRGMTTIACVPVSQSPGNTNPVNRSRFPAAF